MTDDDRDRRMVALLEQLLVSATDRQLSLENARRVFDVGEWHLSYEEPLHTPESERLALLKADSAAAFATLDEWFGVGP